MDKLCIFVSDGSELYSNYPGERLLTHKFENRILEILGWDVLYIRKQEWERSKARDNER